MSTASPSASDARNARGNTPSNAESTNALVDRRRDDGLSVDPHRRDGGFGPPVRVCDVRTDVHATNASVAYAAPSGPPGSRPPGSGANQTRFAGSRTAQAESAPALGAQSASGIASPFSPSGVTWNSEPHVTTGVSALAGSPQSRGAVRTATIPPARVVRGGPADDPGEPSKENTIPRVTSASSLASRIVGGVATGLAAVCNKRRRRVDGNASVAVESAATAEAAPSDFERATGNAIRLLPWRRGRARAEVSSGAAAGVASAVRRSTAASAALSPARPERRISARGTGPHPTRALPVCFIEEGPEEHGCLQRAFEKKKSEHRGKKIAAHAGCLVGRFPGVTDREQNTLASSSERVEPADSVRSPPREAFELPSPMASAADPASPRHNPARRVV